MNRIQGMIFVVAIMIATSADAGWGFRRSSCSSGNCGQSVSPTSSSSAAGDCRCNCKCPGCLCLPANAIERRPRPVCPPNCPDCPKPKPAPVSAGVTSPDDLVFLQGCRGGSCERFSIRRKEWDSYPWQSGTKYTILRVLDPEAAAVYLNEPASAPTRASTPVDPAGLVSRPKGLDGPPTPDR